MDITKQYLEQQEAKRLQSTISSFIGDVNLPRFNGHQNLIKDEVLNGQEHQSQKNLEIQK